MTLVVSPGRTSAQVTDKAGERARLKKEALRKARAKGGDTNAASSDLTGKLNKLLERSFDDLKPSGHYNIDTWVDKVMELVAEDDSRWLQRAKELQKVEGFAEGEGRAPPLAASERGALVEAFRKAAMRKLDLLMESNGDRAWYPRLKAKRGSSSGSHAAATAGARTRRGKSDAKALREAYKKEKKAREKLEKERRMRTESVVDMARDDLSVAMQKIERLPTEDEMRAYAGIPHSDPVRLVSQADKDTDKYRVNDLDIRDMKAAKKLAASNALVSAAKRMTPDPKQSAAASQYIANNLDSLLGFVAGPRSKFSQEGGKSKANWFVWVNNTKLMAALEAAGIATVKPEPAGWEDCDAMDDKRARNKCKTIQGSARAAALKASCSSLEEKARVECEAQGAKKKSTRSRRGPGSRALQKIASKMIGQRCLETVEARFEGKTEALEGLPASLRAFPGGNTYPTHEDFQKRRDARSLDQPEEGKDALQYAVLGAHALSVVCVRYLGQAWFDEYWKMNLKALKKARKWAKAEDRRMAKEEKAERAREAKEERKAAANAKKCVRKCMQSVVICDHAESWCTKCRPGNRSCPCCRPSKADCKSLCGG